jgi:N-acetylmuramoyl-L-alanine amidase
MVIPPGPRRALAAAALALGACTSVPPPFQPAIEVRHVPSPSFDLRRPRYVILHHTTNDTAARALATLTDPQRMVSAHYLVGRDGVVYQLVDERYRAWHAGTSRWGSESDINSASIGIELDNSGFEAYPPEQLRALLALLADIRSRHDIPRENFLAHGDVAPGRKVDPGALFPWKLLAQQGFGAWCEETPAQIVTPAQAGAGLPDLGPGLRRGDDEQRSDAALLAVVGYDVTNLDAAVRAFNRHFMALEDEPVLSPEGRAILACLVRATRGPST